MKTCIALFNIAYTILLRFFRSVDCKEQQQQKTRVALNQQNAKKKNFFFCLWHHRHQQAFGRYIHYPVAQIFFEYEYLFSFFCLAAATTHSSQATQRTHTHTISWIWVACFSRNSVRKCSSPLERVILFNLYSSEVRVKSIQIWNFRHKGPCSTRWPMDGSIIRNWTLSRVFSN